MWSCSLGTGVNTHTLMDMRTDLTAVPHASLGLVKRPEVSGNSRLKAIGFGLEVNASLLGPKT